MKFVVVGGTGAVLNTAVLYVLFRWPGVPLVVASALGAELAVVNNYLLVGAKTKTTATVAYQMLGLYPSTMSHAYAVEAGKTRLHLAPLHPANLGQRRTL